MDDYRHGDGHYDMDHGRRCSNLLDLWRFAHYQIRLEPEGGNGVIELSIGILALAIAILFIGDRQTEKRVSESYEEGFVEGIKFIVEKRYERFDEHVTKKD